MPVKASVFPGPGEGSSPAAARAFWICKNGEDLIHTHREKRKRT